MTNAFRMPGREAIREPNVIHFTMFTNFTYFTNCTTWCYTDPYETRHRDFPRRSRRGCRQLCPAQEVPPALTTVMQAALREYLGGRGFLHQYRPLKIAAKGNSGRSDVSQNHDLYLTGMKK
jgi:hypothetical protein